MKVNTTFRHMDSDDALRAYVEEKVTRLAEKYFHRPQEATVVLEAEKFRRIAEISIKADGHVVTGKEEKEDLRAAIDLALDKIEKQARRQREKQTKKRRGPDNEQSFAVYRGDLETAAEDKAEAVVIREDKFVPKPMTVEDAIMILDEVKDDFVVFRDAASLQICVIYRREDGNYGLIEPER